MPRTITTRRPKFDFGERLGRRHFAQGDLLTSHLVALLSAIIPEGERFVVDAVKQYRSDIEDPDLRKQANAFVGQETMHQREHERLNRVLRTMGYPTMFVHRTGVALRRIGRCFPRRTQLAITAAIEHWTAIIAEHALGGDRRAMIDVDEEVQAFLTWHLIEEIEHKSVAFDVMRALGTTERQRIAAMRVLVVFVGPGLALGLLVSLAKDPAAWNPANIWRSLRWVRANSSLSQGSFGADLRSWSRHGFHPDDRDDSELLERWKADAFGPGSIVERRSRRPAA
ncbi:MAG: metal-dependent hydrolase [Microthrixaceae bacterium]